MKPSAVLLIDLENFYHSRRDFFRDNSTPVGDQPDPSADLAAVVKYAEKLSGLPLSVRRAYANFNTLAVTPRDLMHRGIEPVQVFCLADTSNKNAADMKLAMDAVALASSGAPFEHFVLVTGDSDFIPVILELKNRGFGVSAIAVPGSTSPLIRRFVDGFKWFDETGAAKGAKPQNRLAAVVTTAPVPDPEAAGEPPAGSTPAGGPEQLPNIAAALQQVLTRSGPIRFNQVHRVLSKELGYSFDPAAFAAASTGAFIRRNAAALGVSFRGSNNELEVYLPESPVTGTNGTHAPVLTLESEQAPQGDSVHTAHGYHDLLASGTEGSAEPEDQELQPPPWPWLARMCDDTFAVLSPPTGGPCPAGEFQKSLSAREQEAGDECFRAHVSRALRVLKLSNAVLDQNGRVALHPHVTEAEDVRGAVLWALLRVLAHRLQERNIPGTIRAEAFLAAIGAGPLTGDLLPQISQAIEDIEHELAEPESETPALTAELPAEQARTEIEVETVAGSEELVAPEPEFVADSTAETVSDGEASTEAQNRAPDSGATDVSTDWADPGAFDGAIPDVHPPEPAPSELARARAESAPEVTPPEESSGELDVAEITRAVVESSQESVEARISREIFAERQPPPEPEPESEPEPVPSPDFRPDLPTRAEQQAGAPSERGSGALVQVGSIAPLEADPNPPEPIAPIAPIEAPPEPTAQTGSTRTPALSDGGTPPNPPSDDIPFAELVEDEELAPRTDAPRTQATTPRNGSAPIVPADAFGGVDMIVSPLAPDVPEPPLPPMPPGSA